MSLSENYLNHLKRMLRDRIGKTPTEWVDLWQKEYYQYLISKEIELGLALLFPSFYLDRNGEQFQRRTPDECPIRGPRSFGVVAPHRCDWKKLTGHVCEFHDMIGDESCKKLLKPALDHAWPYSLGGGTVDRNKVTLCRWHNGMIKGADNAYFEYLITNHTSHQPNEWIMDALEKLNTLLERS